MKLFSELVVVELAGSAAGAWAGKLFADYGARVIKVEPICGDPQRALGESWGDTGTHFTYLNTGKQSVALDTEAAPGRALLEKLLGSADVSIESASPGPLEPVTLSMGLPLLVKVYATPFGLTGPYAGYRSTPFTDYAAGGHMYLSGEPDREPLQGAGRQAEYAAGTHAFIGAMAAIAAREATGRGQTVDVSHMETMASLHQWTSVRYSHGGVVQRRVGNRYDSTHPITIYPCKDGYVAVSAAAELQAERLMAVAGLSHLLKDKRFASGVARLHNWEAFDAELLPWLMAHTCEDIVTLCQEARVPVAGSPSMLELLRDRHLAVRDFWATVEGGDALVIPGPPFRFSGHAWTSGRAPAKGESTGSVLSSLGVTELAALRQARLISEPGYD